MGLAALAVPLALALLSPQQKAAMVVVSGLPAPAGVGGVILRVKDVGHEWPHTLVLTDQEGGTVKRFAKLPPSATASTYERTSDAFVAGRATGNALRAAGVHVDLAPVLDTADGPLGSRQFRRPELGLAFLRGLLAGREAACVKHFPGLGSTAKSTDEARVTGVLRTQDLEPFHAAVRLGAPCVMVGHAIYPKLGTRRASLEPATYRLLRSMGFEGVAISDSLGVLGSRYAPYWARLAIRAGADMVLFTDGGDAWRAIQALVPLAEAGELDEHVARVLLLRRRFLR